MLSAWIYAMQLKQSIAGSGSATSVDARALIEVERIRNLAESQISNARSFFLLGSRALFDEQKKEKQQLAEAMANFEKQFNLAKVPEIMKRIEALEAQQQDIFDQGMKYREKQTESKIVGQFYQAKAASIRNELNHALDEIVQLHNAELERTRQQETEAAHGAESRIPRGMTLFTAMIAALFLSMTVLVIRMFSERVRHLAERGRLVEEAKKAVQARDEVISAVAHDLNEPLAEIKETAERLAATIKALEITEGTEAIKSKVAVADGAIKDILDQAKSDMGSMTLRLDQLGIDSILDEARLMMQPLAKQRDIRLQFESVNPPVLAFVDRERVLRVLSNLLGNAIKFSPKLSKVVVKVRSDQQFVYISVADNGPGIPDAQLPAIFDKFWQARKTAEQGAGIGLAVVKTIVEAHGGTVKAESHPGIGSTFTFSLPRRRPVGAHVGRLTPTVKQTFRPQPQLEI